MDWYTASWIGWIAAFGIIEGKALLSKRPGSTLSEHVWRWFRVKDSRPTGLVWLLRGFLLVFLGWLFLHLGFGLLSF